MLSGSADVFTRLNRTRGQARKLKLMGHLPRSALRWGSLAHPQGLTGSKDSSGVPEALAEVRVQSGPGTSSLRGTRAEWPGGHR